MSRRAARVSDLHTCPIHSEGPILPPCADEVLIEGLAAARIDDMASGPGASPHAITGGTIETLIQGRGATRIQEPTEDGGTIVSPGAEFVLIGKVLIAQVIIIAGTYWDSPEGRAEVARQIKEAERILGIRIVAGTYQTVNDPSLQSMQVRSVPGDPSSPYSTEAVDAVNTHGSEGTVTLIYTDQLGEGVGAIAISSGFALPTDGLAFEGAIFSNSFVFYSTAHELGHVLSGLYHSRERNNVMYWAPNATGTEWTDPWSSAAEQDPLLR